MFEIFKNEKYAVDSDNLAVPEVHTGKVDVKDTEKDTRTKNEMLETVAVPEISTEMLKKKQK